MQPLLAWGLPPQLIPSAGEEPASEGAHHAANAAVGRATPEARAAQGAHHAANAGVAAGLLLLPVSGEMLSLCCSYTADAAAAAARCGCMRRWLLSSRLRAGNPQTLCARSHRTCSLGPSTDAPALAAVAHARTPVSEAPSGGR